MAVIRFYTDVAEVEREDSVAWKAVEWSWGCPWTDELENRIAANPDLWLATIQRITAAEEETAAEMKLDADVVASLPDLVLELDFRLTLHEEFGF